MHRLFSSTFLGGCLLTLVACSGAHEEPHSPTAEDTPPTNRLDVSPDVVANLGIRFATATRGKVGRWLTVPGELHVPPHHQWSVRAPATGRLLRTAPPWSVVQAGDVVAELQSPRLQEAQQSILAALSRQAGATEEAAASQARLEEGETAVAAAQRFEEASRRRLEQLRSLNSDGGTFGSGELLTAQRSSLDAAKAALDAAVRRDELRIAARQGQLSVAQAEWAADQAFGTLSFLTGEPVQSLKTVRNGEPVWRTLETLILRAPSPGTIVRVGSTPGETVAEDQELVRLIDVGAIHFHGWVPEGDLGLLQSGAPVRVKFPGGLAEVTTRLIGPLPVADEGTRRLRIEAEVPNPDGKLLEGLSATAYVQIDESRNEEVLLPEDCVVRDGLEMITFVRAPDDANIVVRTPVELGLRGAGQVEVLSGVLAGDQVVQSGIYQLKQAGLGKTPSGGHVHADGTWHADH